MKKNLRYILMVMGIVLVWRGIWGLGDLYLFPQNQLYSFIASLILGIVLLVIIDKRHFDLRELVDDDSD